MGVKVSPYPIISEVDGVTAEPHVLYALTSGKTFKFPLDMLGEAPNLRVFSILSAHLSEVSVHEISTDLY